MDEKTDDILAKETGERIKQIMDSLKLTQQEFAQKLGVSPASLSNIFNGKSRPTMNHTNAIHRAFPTINMSWVMFGEGNMLGGGSSNSSIPPSAPTVGAAGESSPSGAEAENVARADSAEADGPTLDLFPGFDSGATTAKPPANRRAEHPAAMAAAPKVVTETKIVRPKIVEIRVFYDDQTFESFVPSERKNVSR